ncbi:VaFE repeat-containing surface-anchored protein [Enterococcus sp. AZ103]|uniref:VaFE repeat-containing surface-anchored protein n=1 Tax=Enterococcus sp. AZ103 TaxID=2774628 RepID=UPI003F25D38F
MKKGRILRTKLATIAMLLSVGASTFVAPVASLAEATTQSTTETVKDSSAGNSSKEENKNKKETEESKSQPNNSGEKEVTAEEPTVEGQSLERVGNQAFTSDQIQQLSKRDGMEKYNTSGLSNDEIEQLGLAIFGENQPAGASVAMKNDAGENVNIPFNIININSRAIGSSKRFNMSYTLSGNGTTTTYPYMAHHYVDGKFAYCMDPTYIFKPGNSYSPTTMDITQEVSKNVNDVMNFGAHDDSDDVAAGYTQLLVWSRIGWNVDSVGGIGTLDGFKSYQAEVEAKMQKYYAKPSFDKQTVKVKAGQSVTLTDTNNNIDSMKLESTIKNSEITVKGNQLTIKANSDTPSGQVIFKKQSPLADTPLVWVSEGSQSVGTGGSVDPSTIIASVNVEVIKEGKLTLKKTDENGKAIAGAKFNITPTLPNGKKQATKVYTTDANGNFETPVYEEGTKIDYEEIATIAGHYIDPATSKGTIVIKDGGNELVVKNPTVKVALDSQASNVDGAQFVNPLKDQKLRDEVMIDGQQLPENAQLRLTTDYVEFGTGKQLGEESLKKTEEFTAKQAKFVHNVYYDFNAEGMNGKKGVFTNELEYYNPSIKEWEKVASHSDLNNEAESIQFVEPKIHTEFFAFDNKNNAIKNPDPLANTKGYDRVYYENLISDQPYTVDLSIMDKETEKPFTDPMGKEVTGTLDIVAGKDGEVTSKILAKDYYTATKETNDKADTEKDTDKADKETANSGSKVEAKATDTTEKDATETDDTAAKEENDTATEFSKLEEVTLLEGYVDVPFEIDLSQAAGKVLVAYESLSSKGTELTSEKNIDEVKQQLTVNVPETPVKPTTPTKSIPQTWGSLSDMQKVLAAVVMLAIVGAIATVLYLNRKKEVKE